MWETFLLWAFGKKLQNVYRITQNTQVGSMKSGVYQNLWLADNLYVPNIFVTEGACFHAVMHCST
jgi:hypothetical protein